MVGPNGSNPCVALFLDHTPCGRSLRVGKAVRRAVAFAVRIAPSVSIVPSRFFIFSDFAEEGELEFFQCLPQQRAEWPNTHDE